jgi:hypothetical protein
MSFLSLYGVKRNEIMKSQQTDREPFAFKLTRYFLPAEESSKENIEPISNGEFYIMLVVVIAILVAIKLLF